MIDLLVSLLVLVAFCAGVMFGRWLRRTDPQEVSKY